MRLRTFLYKIQFRTTFIWSFFSCDPYFWQCWALNFVWNPYSCIINQLKGHSVTSCIVGCVSIKQTLLYNNLAQDLYIWKQQAYAGHNHPAKEILIWSGMFCLVLVCDILRISLIKTKLCEQWSAADLRTTIQKKQRTNIS